MKKLLLILVILGSMQVIAAMEESIKKLKITDNKIELNQQLFEKIEKKNSLQEILNLIAKGADVNAQNKKGDTPLIKAARKRLSDVCLKLIDKGADVNAQNKMGDTPLIWAACRGLSDVCFKLIDKGADMNAQAERSDIPLIWAAYQGLSDVCLELIDKGADVNAQNVEGSTALSIAAKFGRSDVCKLLLDKGADVNKDCDESTPLIVAALEGHLEVCKILLDKGADVNAKDKSGYTPLIQATKSGAMACCETVLAYSVIIPKIDDNIEGVRKRLLTVLCIFKKFKVSKDIQCYILNRDKGLKDELFPIYIWLIKKGKRLPEQFRKTVVEKITDNTIVQMRPRMIEAQKYAKSADIKSILDPNQLKARFGDLLSINIKRRLEFLVKREDIDTKTSLLSSCNVM